MILPGFLTACSPSASGYQPTAVFHEQVTPAIESSKEVPTPLVEDTITGFVVDQDGNPVQDATVRIQASAPFTLSDEEGGFVLMGVNPGEAVTVSAWKDLYYCARQEGVIPPAENVQLTLRLYQVNDNPNYTWVPPTGEDSCYSCKPGVTQVWLEQDAHGKSATNPRFISMYNGTGSEGQQSPLTRYTTGDYGQIPVPPDFSQPYFGPGYKLDFPDSAGNCAACHTPGAAIDEPYGIDPTQVSGVNQFGVHCDFCHKIAAVRLDPQSGLPYPNMPGVLSMDIRRPFPEDEDRYQLFFGTFDDDNVPEEDTRLPLIEQSQFCAPCHYGIFWDTLVYNSFGEWLESPYSDPVNGKTCQECHTPAPTLLDGEPITNVAPEAGGVERDPGTIHAHTFPGAASQELLENALSMQTSAARDGEQVVIEVSLTNDQTGHHVPTDSPLRHMILLVEATDAAGEGLELLEGETVPEWGGAGDPQKGYYAGLPGKAYAKVLMEMWTGIAPTGAYWNHTRVVSDNRLAAYATDSSRYVFSDPAQGEVKITVRLIYRRAFRLLADQKGWEIPDIVMERAELVIPPSPPPPPPGP
jgi:hypothetical protein